MNEQLQNLKTLLAVGERILADRLPLAFDFYDCGTYACWFGWYSWRGMGSIGLSGYAHTEAAVLQHFGITRDESQALFQAKYAQSGDMRTVREMRNDPAYACDFEPGPAAYAELERRLVYLRDLIAGREPKRGIPESVLSIFDADGELLEVFEDETAEKRPEPRSKHG